MAMKDMNGFSNHQKGSITSTILVIDDDPIMRETIRDILQVEGFKVILASNGKEGMRSLEMMDVDIILTDVLMPEKDGIEVIMDAKRKHPKVKIIALSGGGYISAENYLTMAQNLGANETVMKPFDIDDLMQKVVKLTGNGNQIGASN
jgi:DNA-binding response OmpR family regulator